MTLSDLSIQRPVLATVFAIVIIIFGAVSFTSLGVREYPSVDPPIVSVRTDYTGANAAIIETQITEPLEEEINKVAGIKSISAVSSDGRSNIRVEFDLGMDIDNAANDVRDKVSQALRSLPPDADPPVVSKADADAETILAITLQSDSRSLLELSDLAENVFAERLQTIPGVSEVNLWGEKEYAMRLVLQPDRLAAYGLSVGDIRDALNNQNLELPTGQIEGSATYLTVRTFGRLNNEEAFNNLIIEKRGNSLIRVRDVGEAKISALNEKSILRGNGGIPMVGVAIQPQPGSNYLAIVDEAYRRVDQLREEMPDDITLGVGLDVTRSIRQSIEEVQSTIFIAFALVVVVIFIFLRNWRTTLIPILTIPISLIGTFALLYLAGYSINVLSLLGMLLATGLVVDDAIVVMENIYSRIEEGMHPVQAAFKGARQVFFAVIATTITLVCVFLPLFFLEGLTGMLFREFAAVVAGAVMISTFVSLSLTPMLSGRWLKKKQREPRLLRMLGKPVEVMITRYRKSLETFMRARWLAIPMMVVSIVAIWLVMNALPSELAPLEDKSRIRITATAPEGTSYEMMDRYQMQLINALDTIAQKDYLLSVTSPSFGSSGAVNRSFIRLSLAPPEERDVSQMEITRRVKKALTPYNFARTFVVQEPTISTSGGGSLPLQFVLQAPDLERLEKAIPAFMAAAEREEAFDAVDVDVKFTKPELTVRIDRNLAMDMQVSVRDIVETLQTYFSEQRLGYFIREGKQYYVISEAERAQRNEPADLSALTVRTASGKMVRLANLVTMEQDSRPPQLRRYNRYTAATVSASLADGYSLGDGIEVMRKVADDVLDDSFTTSLTGQSEDFAESSGSLLLIFVFALLLVYLTLAGQFESFRDPFTIMFTVPLALAGALISLYLFNQTLNIFSQIGMIVLIGLVTKNGILIVEFANQKRNDGMPLKEAVIEAAADRFRPILMTSLATVLGALPLVVSLSGVSNSRVPMGISIIGGMLFSLALTLYVIPALYTFVASKQPKKLVVETDSL